MNDYVIYRIIFPDGLFYIGKAKNFKKRKEEHLSKCTKLTTLKDKTLFDKPYKFEIIEKAPFYLTEEQKQIWLDNTERKYIHDFAEITYREITGDFTKYSNYSDFKDIINSKMVNTILY